MKSPILTKNFLMVQAPGSMREINPSIQNLKSIGLTHGAPETGFFRESMGQNEVFSSKNPVSLVA